MENYYVKIQGKANIPTRLDIGHNYTLTADCSITSETKSDNDNGEFDVIFKAEPVTLEVTKPNGEIVKAKDIRKNSTKVRNYLYRLWQENNVAVDFDTYYDRATSEILKALPSLIINIK